MNDEAAGSAKPRLNPFAFPSDLDFRFALLVALVLSSSVFFDDVLWFRFPGHAAWFTGTAQRCLAISPPLLSGLNGLASTDLNDTAALRVGAYSQVFDDCTRSINLAIGEWLAGGLLILLLVALVIYWVFPAWTIRRNHLVALEGEDAMEILGELASLCRQAELKESPTFLVEPLNSGITGLAFGRLGRYYVSLAGGLVVSFYRDVDVFRAVVRHELAHLRNRDVNKTYLVVAIWWAFLVATVAPFIVTMPSGDLGWVFDWAWRGVILVLIVYLTRNAVLRSREVYADLRASVWDGPTGALRRIVAALPNPASSTWRFVWQVHPRPGDRRRFIDETDGLFRAGIWDAVGAGLAASMAYQSLEMFAYQFVGGRSDVSTSSLLATLAVAPLVVGVVGVGVWRQTFAGFARDQAPIISARLGVALGVGAALGQVLAFSATSDPTLPGGPPGTLIVSISQGLWDVGLVIGLAVFVWWLGVGAAAWLGALGGSPGSRRAMVAGLVLGGFLLTWWYGQMLGTEGVANQALVEMPGLNGILLAAVIVVGNLTLPLAQNPLTLIAATVFWSFPLVANLRRPPEPATDRGWAFLDPAPDPPTRPDDVPRLGSALGIGLRRGLACAALLLISWIAYRVFVSAAARNQDGVILAFYGFQVWLAVLLAAIAAGVAAGRPHPPRVLHGLAAACCAAATSAVAILVINLAFGGHAAPQFVWSTFSTVVSYSAIVALPVALIWARRARGKSLAGNGAAAAAAKPRAITTS